MWQGEKRNLCLATGLKAQAKLCVWQGRREGSAHKSTSKSCVCGGEKRNLLSLKVQTKSSLKEGGTYNNKATQTKYDQCKKL